MHRVSQVANLRIGMVLQGNSFGSSRLGVLDRFKNKFSLARKHESSLSVGGTPCGAVGGTSESTERDQNPDVAEMKMPPAVAAAEGDETKNPKR